MKIKGFKNLLADCITSPKGAPVWSCGYAFLQLTEKQVETLRVAVQANPDCIKLENGSVMLPNGIILRKVPDQYSIYVNGQFHHYFDAWNNLEAIKYALKKSELYGGENVVALRHSNNTIAQCYCGVADLGVES